MALNIGNKIEEAKQYLFDKASGIFSRAGYEQQQSVNGGLGIFTALGVSVSGAKGILADVKKLPIFELSKSKMPNIADNIESAIKNGQPSVLTRIQDKAQIQANRKDALRGQKTSDTSLSLDEYPFASTKQGGAGAQVKPVPRSEQNSQGGQMKNFYEKSNIKDGDSFRVKVVE